MGDTHEALGTVIDALNTDLFRYKSRVTINAKLIETEVIDDIECSGCNDDRRTVTIERQNFIDPPLLLVVLSRYNSLGKKLFFKVQYLTKIWVGSQHYSLVGVVHHEGRRPGSGHYHTEIVRSVLGRDVFYGANDSRVTKQKKLNSPSSTAYIFLYQKM